MIDSVAEDVPLQMETDSQRLKQILINLLRNSTKFTFKGFIHMSLQLAKLIVVKD